MKPALPFGPTASTPPAASPLPSAGADAAPPPPDISVELCATIAAEIDGGQVAAAEILKREKLLPETWAAAERRWASSIEEERRRGKSALQDAFDDAYVAQIERGRGPIQPEELARLEVGIERSEIGPTLSELRLPRAALMRVQRVWLRKIMADPGLATKVRRATSAARSA